MYFYNIINIDAICLFNTFKKGLIFYPGLIPFLWDQESVTCEITDRKLSINRKVAPRND